MEYHLINGILTQCTASEMTEAQRQEENLIRAEFFKKYPHKSPLVITQGYAKPNEFPPYSPSETACYLDGVIGSRVVIGFIAENKYDIFNQASLLLRSVEQLEDDELKNIAVIIEYKANAKIPVFYQEKELIAAGKIFLKKLMLGQRTFSDYSITVYQFLLSISIALPFTTTINKVPITLPVETLVKLGWCQIR